MTVVSEQNNEDLRRELQQAEDRLRNLRSRGMPGGEPAQRNPETVQLERRIKELKQQLEK